MKDSLPVVIAIVGVAAQIMFINKAIDCIVHELKRIADALEKKETK